MDEKLSTVHVTCVYAYIIPITRNIWNIRENITKLEGRIEYIFLFYIGICNINLKRKKETVGFYFLFTINIHTIPSSRSAQGWNLVSFDLCLAFLICSRCRRLFPFKKLFVSRNSLKELNWWWRWITLRIYAPPFPGLILPRLPSHYGDTSTI